MRKCHYVGRIFKLWKVSWGPAFKVWGGGGGGSMVPRLNLRWVSGPSFPVPILTVSLVPGPRVLRPGVWSPVPTFTPCQEILGICCGIIKALWNILSLFIYLSAGQPVYLSVCIFCLEGLIDIFNFFARSQDFIWFIKLRCYLFRNKTLF